MLFPKGVVKIRGNAAIIRGFKIINGKFVISTEGFRIVCIQPSNVNAAGFNLCGFSVFIKNNFENNFVDMGHLIVIRFVFGNDDGLSLIPADKFITARTDWMTVEIIGHDIFAFQ